MTTPILFGLFLLVGVLVSAGPAWATRQNSTVADAELNVSGELRTDQPVTVLFDLKGYKLPNGSYSSINVRFATKPEGPEPMIRTGYPKTTLIFSTPGIYRTTFILNEVSKPSCGGVDAKRLMEKTIEFNITE